MPDVYALEGVPHRYSWGSTTTIPRLLGDEPDGDPVAELWFGAHPGAPSPVDGTTLDKLIASDPAAMLGTEVLHRFGPELPYLVKILAADRPLSLQVHPNRVQAERGFARENALGIATDAADRCYRDAKHKPELLCALSEFDALCGFRPVARTIELLDHLAVPGLAEVRAALAAPDGLRAAFGLLLTRADPAPVIDEVIERAARPAPPRFAGALRSVQLAGAEFPGDPGVLVSLLLNDVRLAPGEAIYLAPGNVHVYLHGTAVEIMAASDNVVRAGLTPKHVDVAELLAITDFTELPEPRWPDEGNEFGADFRPPVADFALFSADLDAYRKPGRDTGSCAAGGTGTPHVVLCLSGAVTVRAGEDAVALGPGRAAFVPARAPMFHLVGTGKTFVATVGIP